MRKGLKTLIVLFAIFAFCACIKTVFVPTAEAAENTTEFFGGDGTAENPYIVGTKAHLDNVRLYPDACFELIKDIVFLETDFLEDGEFYNNGALWKPIGTDETPFTGTFNGGGYTISGLTMVSYDAYSGLFGCSSGTITNLTVAEADFEAYSTSSSGKLYLGGIVGYNNGTLEDCTFKGSVVAESDYCTSYAGGIAGYSVNAIKDCKALGLVYTYNYNYASYSGGIVGYTKGDIENCEYETRTASDRMYGGRYVGGIAGYSSAAIKNCVNKVEIFGSGDESTKSYYGGIAGYSTGSISSCENYGFIDCHSADINSTVYGGGIVGYGARISSCENYAVVDNRAYHNMISYSISVTSYVGGIAGHATQSVENCSQYGSVVAQAYYYRPTPSSATFGGVSAYVYAGGIVGSATAAISCCYNGGSVAALSYEDLESISSSRIYYHGVIYAGGMTGQLLTGGTVSNCYNAGNVFGKSTNVRLGGIVGENSGAVSLCYTVGTISNTYTTANIGPIIGSQSGTCENVYYLDSGYTPASGETVIGKVCTLAEMKKQETFEGFDFNTVWTMDENTALPTLKSNPYKAGSSNTTDFAGGNGSILSPYLIETAVHLNNVRNYPGACYKVIADITFTSADFASDGTYYNDGAFWLPIESFGGSLDGDGHTISGIKQNVSGGTKGGIFAENSGTIKGLTVSGTFEIANSTSNASVEAGSIAGSNYGTIESCKTLSTNSVSCNVSYSTYGYAGSIVGYNSGTVKNCENAGSVYCTYTRSYAGGVVGKNAGTIEGCTNSGAIEGRYSSGGITAYNLENGVVTLSKNSGTVITSSRNGYATGDPKITYAGGIAGWNNGEITKSYNTGTVTANGYNGGESYSVTPYAGGIAGNSATIENCYNTGKVTTSGGYKAYAGGIAGSGTIPLYCYNTGMITSSGSNTNYTGTGSIAGYGSMGSTCYFLENTAVCGIGITPNSDYTNSCTSEEMAKRETYASFDFDTIWQMETLRGYSYPTLRGNWDYTVTSVEITTAPEGEIETVEGLAPIAIENCEVKITYSDGKSFTVSATGDMIPSSAYENVGTTETPLEYCGVYSTEKITVTVKEKSVSRLEIISYPRDIYMVGETFEPDQLYLVVFYDNGTETVGVKPESITGYDSSVVGTKTLTAYYGGKSVTLTVYVYECSSIAVTTLPTKTTYVQGQPLSIDGGKITATLTDGTTSIYSLSEADSITYPKDKTGTVTVTVTAFGKTTTFNITVTERIASSLSFVSQPSKTVYFIGEKLDVTGGVIKVVFESDDDYTEEIAVTEDMVSGFDSTVAAYPDLTVSYGGKTLTYTIRVRDYSYTAACENGYITITVSAVPDDSLVIVNQFDEKDKMVSVHKVNSTLKSSTNIAVKDDTVKAYMYLVDSETLVPLAVKKEVALNE